MYSNKDYLNKLTSKKDFIDAVKTNVFIPALKEQLNNPTNDLTSKQDISCMVTEVSSDSTDQKYPTAKAVEDRVVRLKNYIDYQYGPHTVWEVTDSNNGITYSSGKAKNLAGSDWKIQNLDLTSYKFILAYIRGCKGTVEDQEGSSLTIRVDLDPRSATPRLGYYCGTEVGYAINDNGVKAGAVIVVDSTKTKVAMIYSNFNTTGTTALERDYKLYKIEGYYEDSAFDEQQVGGITRGDIIRALGFTPYDSANPNGFTDNIGTVNQITLNGQSLIEDRGAVDIGYLQSQISANGILSCDGNGNVVSADIDLSEYYRKSETSSSAEIDAALNNASFQSISAVSISADNFRFTNMTIGNQDIQMYIDSRIDSKIGLIEDMLAEI